MASEPYAPGTFSWVELMTTDEAGAKAFYAAVFGWQMDESPTPDGGHYVMLQVDGKDAGGLYTMNAQQVARHVPPSWLSYLTVSDLEATVERVRSAGGEAVVEPMDVRDLGRMAVVQDPVGAVFALWAPGKHHGAAHLNGAPGSATWQEHWSRDHDRAERFYAEVFGWRADRRVIAGTDYTVFMEGDRGVAGMTSLPPEVDAPAYWLVYFAVDDLDAALRRSDDAGGRVIVMPEEAPGVGRFAMLQDPQGAPFGVLRAEPPAAGRGAQGA